VQKIFYASKNGPKRICDDVEFFPPPARDNDFSRPLCLAQATDTNMLYNELGTVPEGIDGIDHEALQHICPCFGYKGSRKASTRYPGIFNSEASPLSSSGMGW
jgi:hypothetical protein